MASKELTGALALALVHENPEVLSRFFDAPEEVAGQLRCKPGLSDKDVAAVRAVGKDEAVRRFSRGDGPGIVQQLTRCIERLDYADPAMAAA